MQYPCSWGVPDVCRAVLLTVQQFWLNSTKLKSTDIRQLIMFTQAKEKCKERNNLDQSIKYDEAKSTKTINQSGKIWWNITKVAWNQKCFFSIFSAQRMIIYLAVVDLLFSIPHPFDHIYAIFQIQDGFEGFCVFFAFTLQVSFHYLCLYNFDYVTCNKLWQTS